MDKTNEKRGKAILRSAAKPSQEIQGRLLHFLMRRYKKDFTLQWEQDIDMTDGFVLQAGSRRPMTGALRGVCVSLKTDWSSSTRRVAKSFRS